MQKVLCFVALLSFLGPAQVFAGGPAPITGVIVANADTVHFYQEGSAKLLARCEIKATSRTQLPPFEEIVEHRPGCGFSSLKVHPATGRWAASIAFGGADFLTYELRINNTLYEVPRHKKANYVNGSMLVIGDVNGLVAAWLGDKSSTYVDGAMVDQRPIGFSDDGDLVYANIQKSTKNPTIWSWSFESQPKLKAQMHPPWITGLRTGPLIARDTPVVIRGKKLQIARMPQGEEQSLQDVKTLKLRAESWESPIVVGDEIFYFQPASLSKKQMGRNTIEHCDPERAGTYRRVNILTGQDQVWRHHTECTPSIPLFVVPHAPASVLYFHERDGFKQEIWRMDIATNAAEMLELPVDVKAHAVSDDGRLLLVSSNNTGAAIWDHEQKKVVWQVPVDTRYSLGMGFVTSGKIWTFEEPGAPM